MFLCDGTPSASVGVVLSPFGIVPSSIIVSFSEATFSPTFPVKYDFPS